MGTPVCTSLKGIFKYNENHNRKSAPTDVTQINELKPLRLVQAYHTYKGCRIARSQDSATRDPIEVITTYFSLKWSDTGCRVIVINWSHVYTTDKEGKTPLHFAVEFFSKETVQLLFNNMFSINVSNATCINRYPLLFEI